MFPHTPTHAPADPNATTGDGPDATAAPPVSGDRYRLGAEIARGGMGAVYRATDAALGREVAVKVLLDKYAPHSGTARRFDDEARITGQLQHPNIPAVYDVGVLPDGRPFLAMKLIKGETLDDLLKARRDPAADRGRFLGVFEKVCEAVAYAHAHDVLHRDLKPQNVMVGAFGEVQVMDWGLAKVLHPLSREAQPSGPDPEATAPNTAIVSQRDSEDLLTQAGSVLGTPAYMAPEQAIGAVDQLDRRTDVFGLGGILASILTGKPPFVGPTAESTRQLAANRKLGDCFARLDGCGAEPELVALCRRCLAGEPADRPADAKQVTDAVAALRAAADDRARRAELDAAEGRVRLAEGRKRRRVALVLGGLVLAAVAAGGTAAGVQWRRAVAQEAKTAAALDEANRNLADRDAARGKELAALRRLTDEFVEDQLGARPELTAESRAFLAEVLGLWQAAADTRGDGADARAVRAEGAFRVGLVRQQLGDTAEAEAAYRAALGLWAGLAADAAPAEPDHRYQEARTRTALGNLLLDAGRAADAEAAHRAAIGILRPLADEHPARPDYRHRLVQSLANLGRTLDAAGRTAESAAAYREALGVQGKLAADFPDRPDYRRSLARAHYGLSFPERAAGRWAEAEAACRAALGIQQRLATDFPARPEYRRELADTHKILGTVLHEIGRVTDAEAALRAALGVHQKLAADFPARPNYQDYTAGTLNNLGVLLQHAGRMTEAEAAIRAALAIKEALAADFPDQPDHRLGVARGHLNLGRLLLAVGRDGEAESEFRTALAILQKLAADFPDRPEHRKELATAHNNLAAMMLDVVGRMAEKLAESRAALASAQKLAADFPDRPEYQMDLAFIHRTAGLILTSAGRVAEAEKAFRAALAIVEKLSADYPSRPDYRGQVAEYQGSLGGLLRATGRVAEAEKVHRAALAIQEKLVADFPAQPDYREKLARNQTDLGRLLRSTGRAADAEKCFRAALGICEKLATDSPTQPRHRVDLAVNHAELGYLFSAAGRVADAEAAYRAAVGISEKLTAEFPADPYYREYLGSLRCDFGIALKKAGRLAEAADWHARAIATLAPVRATASRPLDVKGTLYRSHWERATLLVRLGRPAEAVADWDRAVELAPPNEQVARRKQRLITLGRTGQTDRAVSEAAAMLALPQTWDAPQLYNFAYIYAIASGKTPARQAEYADRAMDLLRRAVAAGWKDAAHMWRDADLDPLRGRPDFRQLLADLGAAREPAPKPRKTK